MHPIEKFLVLCQWLLHWAPLPGVAESVAASALHLKPDLGAATAVSNVLGGFALPLFYATIEAFKPQFISALSP